MRSTPLFALAAIGLGIAAFVACDDNTGTPPTDYTALIKDLTENVVIPEQNEFATNADALSTAASALGTDQASLSALQTAWRTARASWRVLDSTQFGPIADLDIASRIDSGPTSTPDLETSIAGTDAVNVPALGGKSKGFLGLQYLIFSSDSLAKLQADKTGRRKQFIVGMAAEIASSAHQVVDAWTPGKGDYQTQVETAGAGSTKYPTQRAVVDDFVGGVGYALEVIVGIRLAIPLGRKSGGSPDPTQDLTSLSDNDVADLNSSLKGILALYNSSAGFNVRLKAKNVELDSTMTGQFSDCGTKIAAIPAPFSGSLTSNNPAVQAAYTACDSSKTTWNTSATPALGATVKPSDTDGD